MSSSSSRRRRRRRNKRRRENKKGYIYFGLRAREAELKCNKSFRFE
jgi:hypothetical protein